MLMRSVWMCGVATVLFVSGCTGGDYEPESPTPEPTPGVTPTATPGVTPTPTPGVTPTPTAGVTPTPTPGITPTPTPGVTPTATPGVTPTPTPGITPGITPTPTPGITPTPTSEPTPGPTPTVAPDLDGDGSSILEGDCDDSNNTIYPGAPELDDDLDNDCDGAVDEGLSTTDDDGDGLTDAEGDCNDENPDVFPGADELCDDGIDQDCSGEDLSCNAVDDDGDTYSEEDGDCDDADPLAYPGAPETPYDGIDQDCDSADLVDVDGDGVSGAGEDPADCDDENASIYPGADEYCNGVDDDCNGITDTDAIEFSLFYQDVDGDGFGDDDSTYFACTAPPGYAEEGGDCDASDSSIYPGAEETCNELDDNCNGETDEGVTETFYSDIDLDGFGDADSPVEACSLPAGATSIPDDCDDSDSGIYPGAVEVCNGLDDNCDLEVDEGVTTTFFQDFDGDGHGTSASQVNACAAPDGYTASSDDCDDLDASVYPGAFETCDGVDEDCDGFIDEGATFSGAIAAWTGDGTAQDSIGSNHGTSINGATYGAGKVNQAFSFDGVNDYATFGTSIGNFGTSDFTIEFWIRKTTTRGEGIFGKRSTCSHGSFIDIRIVNSVGFEIDQDAGATNYNHFSSKAGVADGNWHHVGLVRKGVTASIYIDGVFDNSKSTSGVTNISNTAELAMGKSTCTAVDGTSYMTGALDEVTVFNRALSADEIADIFAQGSNPKCVSP